MKQYILTRLFAGLGNIASLQMFRSHSHYKGYTMRYSILLLIVLSLQKISYSQWQQTNASISREHAAKVSPSVVSSSTLSGKVICGYQAWFQCYGDGSPMEKWYAWVRPGEYRNPAVLPRAGFVWVDMYPDISDYPPSTLYQTGFQNLGDGRSAKLYSGWRDETIDLHFSWMQTYGIDGIALQNFTMQSTDFVYKQNHDSESVRVKRAAEKYGRIFYEMYDISSMTDLTLDSLETNWTNKEAGALQLTSSPQYARQNGKPVVCIWGIGIVDRPGTSSKFIDIINWFKAQGCYVIGGVPAYWRTCTNDSKPGFLDVYKSLDMISPWMVNLFSDTAGANSFARNVMLPDLAFCRANGIDYQPVMFPGFSWANWNGGAQNAIPRAKGELLWKQFSNIKLAGIQSIYVAMFDEFNEGTAIAKQADSYYEIPTDQYFVTTSADGTYLSSDFYLRLVGKITRVQQGLDPLTPNVTIPYSEGPCYFRTSFEQKYDAQPSISTLDPSTVPANVSNPTCYAIRSNPRIGQYALKVGGTVTSSAEASCYLKAFDVNIPVLPTSNLTFYTYPTDSLARHVSIDLYMSDGSTLRDAGATDNTGVSMHPIAGRGELNTWNKISCNIGNWLNGKTIQRILVGYDNVSQPQTFTDYVEDVSITAGIADSAVTTPIPQDQALGIDFHKPMLKWIPGFNAVTHKIFLGTHPTLTDADLVSIQATVAFSPPQLLSNTTYYWRVDEVNSSGTVTGPTWSFTTRVFRVAVPVQARWNLVSNPVKTDKDSVRALFPGSLDSPAWLYSRHGGYESSYCLMNGYGYWKKFPSVTVDTIQGQFLANDSIGVSVGWNLIGSISEPIKASSITSVPANLITSNFFKYQNQYRITDTIFPGQGYWVKANQAGKLILSYSSALAKTEYSKRIKIVATSELPPPPPDEQISNLQLEIPKQYTLEQNYPNPFNPTTIIHYQLPVNSFVSLKVYDALGQEVAVLVNEMLDAGYKSVEWNSTDNAGNPVASGVYLYRLQAGSYVETKKLVLLR
jgi:hypothetical protein